MKKSTHFDSHRLVENRQILLFLSSTFSDMQEERSALVKSFEKLKLTAARRNVTLSLLDLRWGVTDEEARSGKVISVCLNEIEHSYPFFIGLLGNRYGRAPKQSVFIKNPELLERYPWLKADIAAERSITEIEMLYGALRHLEHPVEAAFYIKQTSKPDDNPKQTALKETVRSQKQYPVENYSDVVGLCALVEQHVCSMLDKYFPDGECTPLERERTAQRAYINSRHSHFVGREKELEVLDTFARSSSSHLVITGDSGMGKSALLANWIRCNENNDAFNLAYHFVGNSFAGNNYESVLRHLCDEIYDIYQIEKDSNRQEKPEEEAQRLVSELASQQKPLVVVIDGINQIMAQKDEKLLLWLPAANHKVKFIFTTLRDDPTMQAFEHRGYEARTLGALTDEERKQFAIAYLEQVGKHLDEEPLQRIIDGPLNRNTLVLRTLLDELICFGIYEKLGDRINYYLSANDLPDFFDRVLKRMEDDYDNGQELVSHTLKLIALSEHGLGEEELLAITGFRQMDWHLFYCAFFNHFVVKGGLITFSHQYVADAVARRYAIGDTKANALYRREIVKYFSAISTDDEIQRQRCISELAHQYYHLGEWSNLYKVILSFEAFDYFDSTNEVLLAKYWRTLLNIDKKRYRLSDYLHIPQPIKETALAVSFNNIGLFVSDYFAEYDIALEYHSKALATRKKVFNSNHPSIAESYNNIGMAYAGLGNYSKASDCFFNALEIDKKTWGMEHHITATTYNNLGGVFDALGDYTKALNYYKKALTIYEKKLGAEHPDTANSYNNIGKVFDEQGDYEKGLEYHFKALAINEKVLGTEHSDLTISYISIGTLYSDRGDYDKALEYYFKALEIRKKVFGVQHPHIAQSYDVISMAYDDQGNYDKALSYQLKALAIREKLLGKEHPDTAKSYNNIGAVYCHKNEHIKALKFFCKSLKIIENKLGKEHPNAATTYNNIALIYDEQGDYNKALKYYYKALTTLEKVLGVDHPETAISYNNIAWVFRAQGDFTTALVFYTKAYQIRKNKLGKDHPDTKESLECINFVKKAMNSSH